MVFTTAAPHVLLDALGVEPEVTGETQRTLRFKEVTGEDLTFSYDEVGRSVAVSWLTETGYARLSLFREGASLLRVIEEGGATGLSVEFRTSDTAGELRLTVFPVVSIVEKVLLA
ncbi:hypothetical protein ACWD0A_31660 [Streptomyces sp. NPDC002867]